MVFFVEKGERGKGGGGRSCSKKVAGFDTLCFGLWGMGVFWVGGGEEEGEGGVFGLLEFLVAKGKKKKDF